ncbi:hypothetical protein RF11_02072 [Thelohanellus kitauei]|uniref:Uncharacterized protein n=1 Tax=Thelohanellus kitauei TaxID=669202 RepID=A0A0C2JB60_THEKT|nr:hypothetical protein RF11_02072 [Thelohanellus kitauei]
MLPLETVVLLIFSLLPISHSHVPLVAIGAALSTLGGVNCIIDSLLGGGGGGGGPIGGLMSGLTGGSMGGPPAPAAQQKPKIDIYDRGDYNDDLRTFYSYRSPPRDESDWSFNQTR